MSEKEEKGQEIKKKQLGRPKKVVEEDQIVDEKSQERLDMSKDKEEDYTIDQITQKWSATFNKLVEVSGGNVGNSVITKWNKLNPFLQNERIKRIYTQAKTYKIFPNFYKTLLIVKKH